MTDSAQPPKRKLQLWDQSIPWYKNLIPRGSVPSWVFLLFILFSAWAYHHDTAAYEAVYEDPCAYCTACQETGPGRIPLLPYTEQTATTNISVHTIV